VVYVSPHESEKRQVGVDFMKPALDFGASPFLHLIGQLKVLKLRKYEANHASDGFTTEKTILVSAQLKTQAQATPRARQRRRTRSIALKSPKVRNRFLSDHPNLA